MDSDGNWAGALDAFEEGYRQVSSFSGSCILIALDYLEVPKIGGYLMEVFNLSILRIYIYIFVCV